jgi:hypothetical protein
MISGLLNRTVDRGGGFTRLCVWAAIGRQLAGRYRFTITGLAAARRAGLFARFTQKSPALRAAAKPVLCIRWHILRGKNPVVNAQSCSATTG